MRSFLQRISSRKFLLALAVQIASVAALFWPEHESMITNSVVRVAALVTLLLAAIGYGKIEASVDAVKAAGTTEAANK
ncbi:MAG: hypothetical protein KAX78_12365 [Phycisphaerae bacterium]|nr:hypothetical protein [Phycisphaerae bacterium]